MTFFGKKTAWGAFAAIEIIAFILMVNSSRQESAIMDELAHIPAGYSYVKYLDYRLNPEHPPLLKALSALPLLFQGLNFPEKSTAWQTDVNGQWDVGRQFLYESGNDADKIVNWSRMAPILLTLILIFFIYLWARELLGRWWGLLPAFLFAFSPAVLAHGHYVTTDIGAAFGIFITTFAFIKYLEKPSIKMLILAGLAFGAAQLLKFSAVLLIPFIIFLAIVWTIRNIYANGWGSFYRILRPALSLLGVFIIGTALIYVVYFLFTLNYPIEKQLNDTVVTLQSFAHGPDPELKTCNPSSSLPFSRKIRCLAEIDIKMAGNKALRPLGEYLLGVIMVMQRSSGGNTSYFLGEVSASGWWYYFPVVFLLKEPIPSLALVFLAMLLTIAHLAKSAAAQGRTRKIMDYLGTHLGEFGMVSFFIFYWLYSIKSPLNIGVRHILPTLPFLYILTAYEIKQWMPGRKIIGTALLKRILSMAASLVKTSAKLTFLFLAIAWYFTEMLFSTPHYLSYFNEFAGGLKNGYRYVTDSNYDWGQDLKYLSEWINSREKDGEIKKVAINYFGGGNPEYYLKDKITQWESGMGNPKDKGIFWFAISVNNLQNSIGKLHPGQQRKHQDEYPWLSNPYKPYSRAGTSIFIYKL